MRQRTGHLHRARVQLPLMIWREVLRMGLCLLWGLLLLACSRTAIAAVITTLPGEEKVAALTFDACETKTPSFFDRSILDYLVREQLPSTIFVSGRFARRNAEALRSLAKEPFIEIENHSMHHPQHMERLSEGGIRREVLDCEALIMETTGVRPCFFRFPAGNHDRRSVDSVEALGYRVVHWTFASGDPAATTTPAQLVKWVIAKTRKGSILIFHINGRGYSTGEALPQIVEALRQKNFRFALLKDMLPAPDTVVEQKSVNSNVN